MANQFIKVKSVSNLGLKHAFVPVQDDEAFRRVQKNAWAFRLSAEFKAMKDAGWSVGFFTLTYNDDCLPYVPECCWRDKEQFTRLPCFNKADVRDFINRLRKHLRKVYHIEQLKFMVCSELGPETHRPHYHGVICWPENGHTYYTERVFKGSVIKKEWRSLPCSDFQLHDAICRIWTKGFVRPRYASGGMDSKGHDHKPFRVDGDYQFCCKYCGKYCCKDLYFYDSLKEYKELIDIKHPVFKNFCQPFHFQCKSLGASLLAEWNTDTQKMDALINGVQFVGSDKMLRIPVYIRNKLVFDTYYQYDDAGNRLVRRQANRFFRENYEEIFEHKADFYAQTFKNLLSPGYLEGRGVDADNAEYVTNSVQSFLDSYSLSVEDMARCYLAWYGVDRSYCFDVPPANQWLGRYVPNEQTSVKGLSLLDHDFLDDLEFACSCVMFGLGLIPVECANEHVDRVSDFHKSEVG